MVHDIHHIQIILLFSLIYKVKNTVLKRLQRMAARRLIEGLKSPWSMAFSGFGVAYGVYYIIE